jgi:hypothetical protein
VTSRLAFYEIRTTLQRNLVRTLDAIHLGSAKAAGEMTVAATDKRLRDAALALGFNLLP